MPRNSPDTALVGDPRNDENLIVDQLHLAFLRFHNVSSPTSAPISVRYATPGELFAEAQRIVRWHYQWMILHEFLPLTCGDELVADILANGRKFYDWRNSPYIPVEFSVAAYRFGHSQVRPSYRANFGTRATDARRSSSRHLRPHRRRHRPRPTCAAAAGRRAGSSTGRRSSTSATAGSGTTSGSTPSCRRRCSTCWASRRDEPDSLAIRNLIRGLTMEVPSGQRVAAAMQETPLPPADLADLEPYGLHQRTPLWFYVLREAEVAADGEHLGPVGGRIVAEVFHGLIDGDPSSYLAQDPDWTPTYGTDDSVRDDRSPADRGSRRRPVTTAVAPGRDH